MKQTMKLKIIILSAFGLFACNNLTNKKTVENDSKTDSLVNTDNSSIEEIKNKTDNDGCDFDKFLKDPKTPKLAKELFLNTAKNPTENEALTYFDKFTSNDIQERAFYFKAVTNSYKIADGAYSEGLGYTGKEFIENNPKAFTAFFDNKNCFTDTDLETWADILILEFAIDSDGESDKTIIEQFINKLNFKCIDCSSTQKETINKLDLTLNKKWKEYFKNMN